MAVRARGPRPIILRQAAADPVDDAIHDDRGRQADDLATALDELSTFADDDTKFLVFRIEGPTGQWAFCKRITPPFNTEQLMEDLQTDYGPGSYAVRVYVDGKIKTTKHFTIASKAKDAAGGARPAAASADGLTTKDLVAMLLTQATAGKGDMAQMMQMSQQQSERTMQMMMTMMGQAQQSQATMIAALMGGRDKFSEVAAVFSPLLAKENGGGKLGELKDFLSLAREFLPGGGGGESEESIPALAMKALSPVLPDLAKGFTDFAAAARARNAGEVPVEAQDYTHGPPPAPMPRIARGAGRFPVLAELAEDVLFYFRRRMDPDIAADGLVNVLEGDALKAKGFTEVDLVPLLAALQGAGSKWLDELAVEGIDLRTDPVWATHFLNALIAVYRGDDGPAERPAGGAGDPAGDGAARPVGVPANAGSEPRAGHHKGAAT